LKSKDFHEKLCCNTESEAVRLERLSKLWKKSDSEDDSDTEGQDLDKLKDKGAEALKVNPELF